MKKFLLYCIIVVVILFLGFTTYYIVANKENIVLANSETQIIKLNIGDYFYLEEIVIHTQPHNGTTIAVEIENDEVVSYNEDECKFEAKKVGATTIKIIPSNDKFGPFTLTANVGDGSSQEFPIYIDNAEKLASIGADGSYWQSIDINTKNKMFYELTDDIRLTDNPWTPLFTTANEGFSGVLNGANHIIYDMTINEDFENAGLICSIAENGVVKNICFKNANISGEFTNAGIVAGKNSGTISLIDIQDSSLTNDSNSGKSGMIVGVNVGTEKTVGSKHALIGMCGVENSKLSSASIAGGITGENKIGNIENSFSALNEFAGMNEDVKFGGIAGCNIGGSTCNCNIKNCHAVVKNLINNGSTSGIVAVDTPATRENVYSNNYYCLDTDYGVAGTDNIGAKKKSAEDMKNIKTYVNWNFKNIWKMGKDYAILRFDMPFTSSITDVDIGHIIEDIDTPSSSGDIGEIVIPTPEDDGDLIYHMVCQMRENPSSGKIYVVTKSATVDMNQGVWSESWVPIGTKDKPFTCQFYVANGETLTFNNLIYDTNDAIYSGFFGYMGSGAVVRGITFNSAKIKSTQAKGNSGVIAGYVGDGATIQDCTVSNSTVTAINFAGLVSGQNYGTITDTEVKVNNKLEISGTATAGAITGANNNVISNCSVNETSISCANGNFGIIAGINNKSITDTSANDSSITSTSVSQFKAGGIAGINNNNILGCKTTSISISGSASSTNTAIGGICGVNAVNAQIDSCSVLSQSIRGYNAGGITANNFGQISLVSVGGIDNKGIIKGCFSGGLTVYNEINATISNCYVNTSLEGISDSGSSNGFAWKLCKDSVISNCFSCSNFSGKGDLNCDTATAYRNWWSGVLSNLPWNTQTGRIENCLMVNQSNAYVQGYGFGIDLIDNPILSKYDVILSEEEAKGSNDFIEFVNAGFSEYVWDFAKGYYPSLK